MRRCSTSIDVESLATRALRSFICSVDTIKSCCNVYGGGVVHDTYHIYLLLEGLAVGLVEIEPDGDILEVFPHSGQ